MGEQLILIVDDEPLFRSSISDALSMAIPDLEVLTVENGVEALGAIAERSPDLIVTDLQMPVMDGFELIARVMSEDRHLPVLVLTGFGDDALREQVMERGALAYFDKPIDIGAFTRTVESMLDAPGAHVEGMPLAGFAQLLSMERKTCCVSVRARDLHGTLYFERGALVHATTPTADGDAAALEIFSWPAPVLDVGHRPRQRAATIQGHLTELIMEAARRHDEDGRNARPTARAPPPPRRGPPSSLDPEPKGPPMATIETSLSTAMKITGAIGVALVDFESGFCLGQEGGASRLNLDVAAAGNTEVVRAKMRVMKELGLDDHLEDILITLGKQYHLIRPLKSHPQLFLYLAIDRQQGNLAMARHQLTAVESSLEL